MLILYTLHEIHRYLINAIKLESCFLGCELCIFIEERYYFLSKKIFFNCSTVLSNPEHLNATGVLYQRILGIVLLKAVSVFGRFFFLIFTQGAEGVWDRGSQECFFSWTFISILTSILIFWIYVFHKCTFTLYCIEYIELFMQVWLR